jgi:pimeloyl-ACP methyl ester carboxylesterase
MNRIYFYLTVVVLGVISCQAQPSLPSSFHAKTIHSPEGADIFVRWGGTGPVALLLHGYAENSDSWAPLAADLMKDHTVVGRTFAELDAPQNQRVDTTRKLKPRTCAPW